MRIKEKYKKVIRDTFFFLLIISILFCIYNYYNPLSFPGLQMKLIIITTLFGILYFYLSFLVSKTIKIRTREVKNIKKKFMIFLAGFIIYSFFLNWVFPKLSFDEFMFFILLLYMPISYILGLESRIPIMIALVLLVSCALVLSQGFESHASRIAIYVYYFLVIGIILLFTDYLRKSRKE